MPVRKRVVAILALVVGFGVVAGTTATTASAAPRSVVVTDFSGGGIGSGGGDLGIGASLASAHVDWWW